MANIARKNLKHFSKSISGIKRLPLKHALIIAGVLTLLAGITSVTVPVTFQETENSVLNFGTKYQDENSIELGEEKVVQAGKEGQQYTKYRYTQTLFEHLFRKNNTSREVIDTGILSTAKEKIVLKGTRKWQYMMCSNGTYRYYTDEQFKDTNIGFTGKSADNCAENNQGKKVSLADSPSGTSNAVRPSYVPPNCIVVDIPYKTVYQNVSWLNIGEEQEGYGFDGFKFSCNDGSSDIVSNPIDRIVYRGTSQGYTVPTITSTPMPDAAAKRVCDQDYNSALAQLRIANATGSSAMIQLQSLYVQCLSRAGY